MPASTTHFPTKLDTERWFPTSSKASIVKVWKDGAFCLLDDVEEFQSETIPKRQVVIPPRGVHVSEENHTRYKLLQKWEGVVLEMDEDSFTSRLIDSNAELPPHQATFARSELSPDEDSQIAVGAPFVWTIGYRHKPSRERVSSIYFRRLPAWNEDELTSARQRGEQLSTAIAWK